MIDQIAADCICDLPPNEDIGDYLLLGKERMARWQETMRECRLMMDGLVDP